MTLATYRKPIWYDQLSGKQLVKTIVRTYSLAQKSKHRSEVRAGAEKYLTEITAISDAVTSATRASTT